ncbi:unnamed protein product [Laminaria digitata]
MLHWQAIAKQMPRSATSAFRRCAGSGFPDCPSLKLRFCGWTGFLPVCPSLKLCFCGRRAAACPLMRVPGRLFCFADVHGDVFCRPGSDLLSRVLRRSTIGAGAFHGRVRNGIGCLNPAITTRSAKHI